MRARRLLLGSTVALLAPALALGVGQSAARSRHGRGPIYSDRSYTPAERAADLVARMTLQEKAAEMISGDAAPIPRLGIKRYSWWSEALHGVAGHQEIAGQMATIQNTTSYPTDLALGSSWDPGLMYQEASAISDEAREVAPLQSKDLDFFAPTVNLSRDPRWGRNDETFSEDPLLTADMAAQYVNGFQGQDQHGRLLPEGGGYLKAIATLKHYTANNDEAERTTGSSDMDERTLREYYTAQFSQIIEQARPGAIMSAYNAVNGTPATADANLIDTLARQTFGFQGYFTSDCGAINDIVSGHDWQAAGYFRPLNETEAHALANAAGEDLECDLNCAAMSCGANPVALNYANLLPAATGEGIRTATDTYNVNDTDLSLERLFTARMELGEFDNVNAEPWVKQARTQLNGAHWTDSSTNGAITETPSRLALDQQVADRTQVLLKNSVIKRRDGSVGALLPMQVPTSGPFKVAVIGHEANRLPMWLGDYSSFQDGTGMANEVTPYAGIKAEIQAIDPSAQVDFYNGFTSGDAADTLASVDPAAVSAASGYNYVIADVGTDWSTSGEGIDRGSLALPGAQAQLVSDVEAANPNTIVAMQTSGDVDVVSFASSAPAIVWSSFSGERQGLALADVLLGKYNPSGHLPFTWYQSEADLPPVTDYAIRPGPGSSGRTFMYYRGPISWPFGYGLSYTTFSLSSLRVTPTHPTPNQTAKATVKVTNTGPVAGEDLVQLYVATPGLRGLPLKRLEGFQQIYLGPGQSGAVTLNVPIANLAFWAGSHFAVRDGPYEFQVANSAAPQDVVLRADVQVGGPLAPVPRVVSASPQMPGDAARGIQRRLLFPVGTTVDPRLTVSMNDETLYRDGALPAKARVTYSSDNPSVVSVSGGTIRTIANGVATITAAVSYNRATAYGQFVVRAVSELGSISLTFKRSGRRHRRRSRAIPAVPLPGFEPDTFSYDETVPFVDQSVHITASSPDSHAHVRVSQAAGVPGVAHVTVNGPDGITQTLCRVFRADAPEPVRRGGRQAVDVDQAGPHEREPGGRLGTGHARARQFR